MYITERIANDIATEFTEELYTKSNESRKKFNDLVVSNYIGSLPSIIQTAFDNPDTRNFISTSVSIKVVGFDIDTEVYCLETLFPTNKRYNDPPIFIVNENHQDIISAYADSQNTWDKASILFKSIKNSLLALQTYDAARAALPQLAHLLPDSTVDLDDLRSRLDSL